MLFVKIGPNKLPLEVSDHLTDDQRRSKMWQTRWDWESFAEVQCLASYLTAMTGHSYVGVDSGDSRHPRFDITMVPQVGDAVSYAINGDCTPDGHIVKVTKTLQVTTSTGSTYRRKGQTGAWTKPGGHFYLVGGHVTARNPHV